MVETIIESTISRLNVPVLGGSRFVLDPVDIDAGYLNADYDHVVLAK